jgi:uncharacterized membrane-anchored protein
MNKQLITNKPILLFSAILLIAFQSMILSMKNKLILQNERFLY